MVKDALRDYVSLATGLTEQTRQRALSAVRNMLSSGEATADQVSALADDLLATGRSNQEAILSVVRTELDRALELGTEKLGLVTAAEHAALAAKVSELERRVAELERAAPAAQRPRARRTSTAKEGASAEGTGDTTGGTAGETAGAPDAAGTSAGRRRAPAQGGARTARPKRRAGEAPSTRAEGDIATSGTSGGTAS